MISTEHFCRINRKSGPRFTYPKQSSTGGPSNKVLNAERKKEGRYEKFVAVARLNRSLWPKCVADVTVATPQERMQYEAGAWCVLKSGTRIPILIKESEDGFRAFLEKHGRKPYAFVATGKQHKDAIPNFVNSIQNILEEIFPGLLNSS